MIVLTSACIPVHSTCSVVLKFVFAIFSVYTTGSIHDRASIPSITYPSGIAIANLYELSHTSRRHMSQLLQQSDTRYTCFAANATYVLYIPCHRTIVSRASRLYAGQQCSV